ncbi:hypothetical protein [Candidatus Nitrosotalea okcheonensis]|uniref:Uncharacterized protein n=1 Tax=Candidatus Nitrosotalea okcheonensis TaxID=1903276 RepID=A0A2H1FFZ1_9ARCH|nr:hypothetical protein [Candidatus Nitrosotalea okcheonensis]SMH71664.1 protein of unknown function [Candidatus Nitrosotalea okcheonensis]
MKRKDLLSCLPQPGKIFDLKEIRSDLKKKGFHKEANGKNLYKSIESLVEENFLEKVDVRHYKVIDVNNRLDLTKYLIRKNLENRSVIEWDTGSGLLSRPRTEGVILGIPPNHEFEQKWQGLCYSILKTRMSNIFHAITELVTSVDKIPVYGSGYVREASLELIPFFIGELAGDDHDGLDERSLIVLIENLVQNNEFRNVVHVEDLEELNQMLTIFKTGLTNYKSNSKKPKDFGMVMFPGSFTIDPNMPHEKDVLEFMGSDLKKNKNAEKIVANLSTWYYPEEVGRIFRKYDGYYSAKITTKIHELHDMIETGFIVIFCLYDIDYCHRVIDGLESKKLKVGYYDHDGHYVGRKNTLFVMFLSDGFYVNSSRPTGSSRLIKTERQIKQKAYYEDIFNKTIEKLKEIFKQKGGIDKCIQYATFASEIKLNSSPRFVLSDMNWKRILKDMGYSPTEDQIQQWVDEGKKEAKKFVKKWINRKRDEI